MTFEKWFNSQQGVAYDGQWQFAKAAWEARDAEIAELEIVAEVERSARQQTEKLLHKQAEKIAALESWKKSGEMLFSKPYGVGFLLGKWWGERPWYKPRTD